jgi:arsenate reductase
MSKPAVLFLCTNNAARSQMAEALLRTKAAESFDVYSAGTEPKPDIDPLTIRVMREVGIDLSGQHPKGLLEYLGRLPVRVAISVCPRAEDKCPTLWPGALARLEWPFEDPAACAGSDDERLEKFRTVRDQIDRKITDWLTELTAGK